MTTEVTSSDVVGERKKEHETVGVSTVVTAGGVGGRVMPVKC
jgi:hypothetical protein